MERHQLNSVQNPSIIPVYWLVHRDSSIGLHRRIISKKTNGYYNHIYKYIHIYIYTYHHQPTEVLNTAQFQVPDAYALGEEGRVRTAAGTIRREVRVVSGRAKRFLDQRESTVESMGKLGNVIHKVNILW